MTFEETELFLNKRPIKQEPVEHSDINSGMTVSQNEETKEKSTDDLCQLLLSLKIEKVSPETPNVLLSRGKPQYRHHSQCHPRKVDRKACLDPSFPDLKVSELYGGIIKIDAPDGFPYNTTNQGEQPNMCQFSSNQNSSFVHGKDFSCQVWSRQNYPFWQYSRSRFTPRDPNVADGPTRVTSSGRIPDLLDGPGGRKSSSISSNDLETDDAPYGPSYDLDDPFLRSLTDQQFPLFEEISHIHRSNKNIDLINENSNSSSSDVNSPMSHHVDSDLNDISSIISEYSNNASPSNKVASTFEKCHLSPGNNETLDMNRKRRPNDGQPSPPKQPHLDFPDADEDGDSVLHSLVIAEDFTEEDMEKILYYLDSSDQLTDLIDRQNTMWRTALFLAVLTEQSDFVQCLLDHGADPNIQGKVHLTLDTYDLRTPLQLSVERGDKSIDITKMLLESPDIDVNARSESDRLTALHLALKSHRLPSDTREGLDCTNTIKLLIMNEADTDLGEDRSSKTPLMLAIDTCDLSLVKAFINCDTEKNPEMIRSKMNATTRSGDTALHFAAGANYPRKKKCTLLRLLVNSGADSSIENNEKEKPESITTKDLWKEAFRC